MEKHSAIAQLQMVHYIIIIFCIIERNLSGEQKNWSHVFDSLKIEPSRRLLVSDRSHNSSVQPNLVVMDQWTSPFLVNELDWWKVFVLVVQLVFFNSISQIDHKHQILPTSHTLQTRGVKFKRCRLSRHPESSLMSILFSVLVSGTMSKACEMKKPDSFSWK